MDFCFYPNHEYRCEHVKHCPHLGSAALGTLVLAANSSDVIERSQWLEIKGLRKERDTKYARIVELEKQVEQLKLELRVERQNKFATGQQQAAGESDDALPAATRE